MKEGTGTITNEQELSYVLTQFNKLIYVDFGIHQLSDKIKNWYELSWDEFKEELEERYSITLNDCHIQDWQDFFKKHKAKVRKIMG